MELPSRAVCRKDLACLADRMHHHRQTISVYALLGTQDGRAGTADLPSRCRSGYRWQ